jgi:chitooligosaccharide deacetylase
VTAIAASLGQRTVGWSRGVWDSALPGVEVIADRSVRAAKPGAILLLHDGDGYDPLGDRCQTARAVPLIVDRIREAGFAFASLETAA